MISSKDLYTIYIHNVKQYHDGDYVKFVLLTRPKDSIIPLQKNRSGKEDFTLCSSDELYDSFSNFILTSDVKTLVREAQSELDGWLARAELSLVDDIENLPYVHAALEQLEKIKKCWSVRKDRSSSASLKYDTHNPHHSACKYDKVESHGFLTVNVGSPTDSESIGSTSATPIDGFKKESKWSGSFTVQGLWMHLNVTKDIELSKSFWTYEHQDFVDGFQRMELSHHPPLPAATNSRS
ncbi:hypothetical protein NE237_013903 [Protea cynaroides]|uniref:Uncharacterized protein n=1 Tax=Protea cynaroides TaxID=273540 RepID=A0A9Q0H0T0_9MAGN|nr:hypothetical protein NE237_013903 [Protea cynaroides]